MYGRPALSEIKFLICSSLSAWEPSSLLFFVLLPLQTPPPTTCCLFCLPLIALFFFLSPVFSIVPLFALFSFTFPPSIRFSWFPPSSLLYLSSPLVFLDQYISHSLFRPPVSLTASFSLSLPGISACVVRQAYRGAFCLSLSLCSPVPRASSCDGA